MQRLHSAEHVATEWPKTLWLVNALDNDNNNDNNNNIKRSHVIHDAVEYYCSPWYASPSIDH